MQQRLGGTRQRRHRGLRQLVYHPCPARSASQRAGCRAGHTAVRCGAALPRCRAPRCLGAGPSDQLHPAAGHLLRSGSQGARVGIHQWRPAAGFPHGPTLIAVLLGSGGRGLGRRWGLVAASGRGGAVGRAGGHCARRPAPLRRPAGLAREPGGAWQADPGCAWCVGGPCPGGCALDAR